MAKKNIDDYIFLFIGDKPFTLKDLGPAADMRFDKAFQDIIDRGLLGAELVGKPWHEVIKSSGLRMDMLPQEEDVLQYTLFQKYDTALLACKELNARGELTQAHKDELEQLRKDWQTAEKLARL